MLRNVNSFSGIPVVNKNGGLYEPFSTTFQQMF